MKVIGVDWEGRARRFAVACLAFDLAVLALIAGVGIERRHDAPPMVELGRIRSELVEVVP